jgi:hypothetical protein
VDTWLLLSLIIVLQDKLLLYLYVWGICLTVSLSCLFGKVLCYGIVLSLLIKKLELFGFNAAEPYNATHWPHIPRCHDKCNPWCPHKGASWEQCVFASPMTVNVAGYKLVYWSHNSTSDTNIIEYWTTPGGTTWRNHSVRYMEARSCYC